MGWTYRRAYFDYTENKCAACLAECRAEFNEESWATIEADALVGKVYYAAMKRADKFPAAEEIAKA